MLTIFIVKLLSAKRLPMRAMELCESSRMCRFSAPLKPWMDVSLLQLILRTLRLIISSQSILEIWFSCRKKKKKNQTEIFALTVQDGQPERSPARPRSTDLLTGWFLPRLSARIFSSSETGVAYTEPEWINCSLASPPEPRWLPGRHKTESVFQSFSLLHTIRSILGFLERRYSSLLSCVERQWHRISGTKWANEFWSPQGTNTKFWICFVLPIEVVSQLQYSIQWLLCKMQRRKK